MPFIDRPGARVHYSTCGSGPAVLMIQGVGVPIAGWGPQLDALRSNYRVACIDNRGIGRSTASARTLSIEDMAADALAVADAEGIQRFHLVGHSMGGIIAQQVALTARERVLSLALLCTFHKGRQGATMTPGLLWTALRSRIGTRRMRRHAFAEIVMTPDYLASTDRDELCERLAALFGRDLASQPSIVMRQVRAMARFDASERLAELAGVPTLVLSAEHDRIARPVFGRALAAAIPGATFIEVAGAGHAVTIQCAEDINDILAAHLQRSSASVTT